MEKKIYEFASKMLKKPFSQIHNIQIPTIIQECSLKRRVKWSSGILLATSLISIKINLSINCREQASKQEKGNEIQENKQTAKYQDGKELTIEEEVIGLERSVEKNPMNIQMKVQLILLYLRLNKLAQAEKFLIKTIQQNPSGYLSYFYLGLVYARLGKEQLAEKELRNCIQLNKAYSDSYLLLASILRKSKQFQSAESVLRSGIENCNAKDKNKLYSILSDIYCEDLSDIKKAISILQEGISKINVEDALIFNQLGRTQLLDEDFSGAQKNLEKSLEIDENIYMNRIYLAVLAEKAGQHDSAVNYLQSAIQNDPTQPTGYKNLANLLFNQKQYTKSLQICKEFQLKNIKIDENIETNSLNVWVLSHMARCQIALKDYENAEVLLQQAVQADPSNDDNLFYLGYAREKQKKNESALQALNSAIQVNPNDSQIYGLQTKCLFNMKRYVEALDSAKIQLQLDPDSIQAKISIADAHLRLRHYQEALFQYNLCIEESTNPEPILLAKAASVHFALKQYSEALHYYKQSAQLQPSLIINFVPELINIFKLILFEQ